MSYVISLNRKFLTNQYSPDREILVFSGLEDAEAHLKEIGILRALARIFKLNEVLTDFQIQDMRKKEMSKKILKRNQEAEDLKTANLLRRKKRIKDVYGFGNQKNNLSFAINWFENNCKGICAIYKDNSYKPSGGRFALYLLVLSHQYIDPKPPKWISDLCAFTVGVIRPDQIPYIYSWREYYKEYYNYELICLCGPAKLAEPSHSPVVPKFAKNVTEAFTNAASNAVKELKEKGLDPVGWDDEKTEKTEVKRNKSPQEQHNSLQAAFDRGEKYVGWYKSK